MNSKMRGFSVEARAAFPKLGPVNVSGQNFDGEWRAVRFEIDPQGRGVPGGLTVEFPLTMLGLYPYETAQALRWWFLAEARKDFKGMETRLLEHGVEYSIKSEIKEPLDQYPMDGDGAHLAAMQRSFGSSDALSKAIPAEPDGEQRQPDRR